MKYDKNHLHYSSRIKKIKKDLRWAGNIAHTGKKCVDNFWDKNLKNKDHPESQGVDEKDNIKVNPKKQNQIYLNQTPFKIFLCQYFSSFPCLIHALLIP